MNGRQLGVQIPKKKATESKGVLYHVAMSRAVLPAIKRSDENQKYGHVRIISSNIYIISLEPAAHLGFYLIMLAVIENYRKHRFVLYIISKPIMMFICIYAYVWKKRQHYHTIHSLWIRII